MKFAKGFLRNFAILLATYTGYTQWQQEAYLWSLLLFVLAAAIAVLSYRLIQKEKNKDD